MLPATASARGGSGLSIIGVGDKAKVMMDGWLLLNSKDQSKAKKVIVFKKKENAKKYKKVATISVKKLKNGVVDKRAEGYVSYKFQPVYKGNKKVKKSKAHMLF